MWRIRLGRQLPRYLLCAAALFGLAASARYAIAPPRPPAYAGVRAAAAVDRAAEGYAVLFARRYLSWNAAQPQASAHALEPFLGAGAEAGAGLVLPPGGEQQVEWAEVVQVREPQPGVHVYTVAAQTDSAGLLYLSVGVERSSAGVELTGYPAFVGAPSSSPSGSLVAHAREVREAPLRMVVERALRNYLAGAGESSRRI